MPDGEDAEPKLPHPPGTVPIEVSKSQLSAEEEHLQKVALLKEKAREFEKKIGAIFDKMPNERGPTREPGAGEKGDGTDQPA